MNEVDLKALSIRESEQVEWKENVANTDDVAETLSAFANDWANLGGGYVVCGAKEEKDEHGFPKINIVGLTADRLKEVEGRVIGACRDRVSPSIAPLVQEIATSSPDRRVLVFIMPATRTAHLFRRTDDAGKYFVRISRQTMEARNGILRELLVRKGAIDEWDRRPNTAATMNDLDVLAIRDALQRMGLFNPDRGIDEFLSDTNSISPFVPPLCFREPLTGVLRPRNFALLLFGRHILSHIPGAYTLFSVYPGADRSEPHAERSELPGNLIEQARRLIELLDVQSYVAFDKTDRSAPNAVKYPPQALHEAMMNGLAHRDYESADPTRITVFSDRIEIVSPGSLPSAVKLEQLREGRAAAKWRNQTLAWFLNRLQLAQAEGQGIPTIIRSMREEGCPPPSFDANESRVTCLLPAHPRHALARAHRAIEEAISLGKFELAQSGLIPLMAQDSMNFRTIQLFAEVQGAVGDKLPVRDFISRHEHQFAALPPAVVTQLADVLITGNPSNEDLSLARKLYLDATRGRIAEQEVGNLATGLTRAGDESAAVQFLNDQMNEHPDLRENPWILRIRGNAWIGLAKQCSVTAKNRDLSSHTRQRAWDDSKRFIKLADQDLRHAMSLSPSPSLVAQIQTHLDFIDTLKLRTASKHPRPDKATKQKKLLQEPASGEPIASRGGLTGGHRHGAGRKHRQPSVGGETNSKLKGDLAVPRLEGTGVVVWFDSQKGFGFISPDQGGEDIFLHASILESKRLKEDQRVKFKAERGPRGLQATEISLL